MAILTIVLEPDERLHMKSVPVEKVDDDLRNLMDDMLETMYDARGIGLSAVQIGVLKRVLVMDVTWNENRYNKGDSKLESKAYYIVNPKVIIASKDKSSFEEGCLSFPEQTALIHRPATIKIEYLDYHGNEQILEAEGILATCLQHEMDHLDGIVISNHVSYIRAQMITKKAKKIKNVLLNKNK